MVAGFPNLFTCSGPNTGLGHTSVVFMIESQIICVSRQLRSHRDHARRRPSSPDGRRRRLSSPRCDAHTKRTVWVSGGCTSWYLDARGRNSALWPTFTMPFRLRTRTFKPDEYVLTLRRARVAA